MANEDIQIVSVAQVECLCLNRRPGVKGEPIDLDSRAGPHQGRAGSSKKKQRVKTASKDKSITITGVSQLPEVQVRKRRKVS